MYAYIFLFGFCLTVCKKMHHPYRRYCSHQSTIGKEPPFKLMSPKIEVIVGTASVTAPGRMALDLHVVQNASIFRSSTQSNQPAGAESTADSTIAVPNAHDSHQNILTGQLIACDSKKLRSVPQIQSRLNYLVCKVDGT